MEQTDIRIPPPSEEPPIPGNAASSDNGEPNMPALGLGPHIYTYRKGGLELMHGIFTGKSNHVIYYCKKSHRVLKCKFEEFTNGNHHAWLS